MAAHTQIVYISIEGSNPLILNAQEIKYTEKDIEFIGIEYTKEGIFNPALPGIDAGTKIILYGHSAPGADSLYQLPDGGGVKLGYQTIADEIEKRLAAGDPVDIAVYGCEAGRASHEKSFAARLFTALVEKRLKPTISASLTPAGIVPHTGKFTKVIEIKRYTALQESYDRCAARVYANNPIKHGDFQSFQAIQRDRRMLFDSKAKGSQVVLRYEESNPDSLQLEYPYGEPDNKLSGIHTLRSSEKEDSLQLLLGIETLFSQKCQVKIEKAQEELNKIFKNFEKKYPHVLKNSHYVHLKEFLLEEEYYVDVAVINQFLSQAFFLPVKEREALLVEINRNQVLRDCELSQGDLSDAWCYHLYPDPDSIDFGSAYLQLGLDVIRGEIIAYSSPISRGIFDLLDGAIQQELAIELGKQMLGYSYNHELIDKYSQLTETDVRNIGRDHILRNEDSRIVGSEFYRLSQGQQDDLALLVGQERLYGQLPEDLQIQKDALIDIAKELSLPKPCQSTAATPREKETFSLSFSKFMSRTFFSSFSDTPKPQGQEVSQEPNLVHRSLTKK